jgi:hypothetical protein
MVVSPPGVHNDLTGIPVRVVHWSAPAVVGALAWAPPAGMMKRPGSAQKGGVDIDVLELLADGKLRSRGVLENVHS